MPLLKLSLSALLLTSTAHGAGYQLAERSGNGLGRAFSGEAAIGDDASILGSNPAGMSLLDDWSFSVGANIVLPHVDANGRGFADNPPAGRAISNRDVILDAVVPYAYLTKKLNEQVTIGFGSYTTYGLKSDYTTNFSSAAVSNYSDLLTVNFNPALSYKVNEQWSLGAGFDALYTDGNLTSLQAGGANLFDLEGDDWGFGYNLGVLFELNEGTRFGLHYRSSIDLKLEGKAEVGTAFGPFAGTYNDAFLEVELPDTLEFSAYHELNPQWAIHADVLWTNWSKFQSLDPKVNPAIDAAFSKEQNWKDAFRFSVGTTYKHNDRLTLRAGVAYDESPVDSSNATLRIPDADRTWLSLGASYVLNDTYTLDLGYTHVFADDLSLAPKSAGGNTEAFLGEIEGSVDIFSIGLSGSF